YSRSSSPPCLAHYSTVFFSASAAPRDLHSFPTRRSSDLTCGADSWTSPAALLNIDCHNKQGTLRNDVQGSQRHPVRGCNSKETRSEEHTSELQSRENLVCRLLLEKKKKKKNKTNNQQKQY